MITELGLQRHAESMGYADGVAARWRVSSLLLVHTAWSSLLRQQTSHTAKECLAVFVRRIIKDAFEKFAEQSHLSRTLEPWGLQILEGGRISMSGLVAEHVALQLGLAALRNNRPQRQVGHRRWKSILLAEDAAAADPAPLEVLCAVLCHLQSQPGAPESPWWLQTGLPLQTAVVGLGSFNSLQSLGRILND